jgi:hypothetical protein
VDDEAARAMNDDYANTGDSEGDERGVRGNDVYCWH